MDERLLDAIAELKRAVEEVQSCEAIAVWWRDLEPVYEAAKRVIDAYDKECADAE